jgi:hypothetical protein
MRYLYLQFDAFMTRMQRSHVWSARTRFRADNKAPAGSIQFRWRAQPSYHAQLMDHFAVVMQLERNAVHWMRTSWPAGRFIRCYFANAFYERCVAEKPLSLTQVHWLLGVSLH